MRRPHLIAWLALLIASDLADIISLTLTGHRLPLGTELLRATLLIP